MKSCRSHRRLSLLALAALLALGGGSLNAAPRSFAGPGSFWDVVANWTGGIVPGAADDALLGAFDTEVRSTFTILSFSGTGTLTVGGGTLSTSAASSIVGFTLASGGTLAGSGAVTVSGAGSWTSGTMTGTGVTTSTGSFAFSGSSTKDLTAGRTLATAGSTTWTNTANDNGRIRTGNGAVINNSGSWDDQQAFNGAISPDFGGTANFNNSGSYTKSGAGTTTIGIAFNNTSAGVGTGVVALNAGGLRLLAGGSSNGSFAALAGTTLTFGGGYTLQAASSVNAAGTVEFAGSGNNSVGGSYSAGTSSVFSGGTTTFTGSVTNVGGSLVANGGTAVFSNAQAINTGSVSISAGGLSFNNTGGLSATTLALSGGTLAGTTTASFSGDASWTSGTMTGTGRTQVAGAMTISGASTKDLTAGRTLGTAGTTTWTNTAADNGRIRTGGTVVIDNTGTWLDQQAFNGAISPDLGGGATFVNSGRYTKSGAGSTTIGIAFNNDSTSPTTGVVAVNAGSLRLNAGGSSNGSFTGLAGTTLGLGGGHALLAGSSVDTAGTVEFTGGTNTIAGSFNAGSSTQFSGGTSTFSGTVSGVGSSIIATGGTGVFNNTQAFAVSSLQLASGGLSFNNTGGVSTGTLGLTGGTLGGTSTVTASGATTWTSGTMTGSGRTQADGGLTLSGSSVKDLTGGRILVSGNTTWTNTAVGNGRIRTGGSAVIGNTGNWDDQQAFDGGISADFGGAAVFDNRGVYNKAGAGTTTISIAFDNTATGAGTGVVNVNAGTLALSGGGTGNGSFQGAGTLVFGGGVYNLLPGSSVANPNVHFNGGTTHLGGSYSMSGITTVNGGTANFTGTVAGSGGSLDLIGGTANFNNLAGVSVATLALSGGTLSGAQDLAVSGASTWSSGTMTGTGRTLANGTLSISGASLKDLTGGRNLVAGDTTWTNTATGNGRIRTGGTALITNSGTWADQQAFDSSISADFGGSARFDNQGVYNKNGAGTTSISIAFDNTTTGAGTGVVNVNAGTLALGGGGSSSGAFQGPGLLVFSGGAHDLLAGSSVANPNVQFSGGTTNVGGSYSVAGTTTVNGGTANFTGNVANSGGNLLVSSGAANFSNLAGVTVSTLALSGGTVGGTQAFTVLGNSGWTGGTMTGAGSTTLQGSLSLSGSGFKDLTGGRTLNAAGTTTWTNTAASNGRIRTGGGAVINNTGSWLDQQAFNSAISADFGGASSFNNAGSYTKSGAATTDMAVVFVNGNATPGSGVVNLNAGTLQLSGGGSSVGTFNLADGTTLAFSAGTYTLGGSVASGASGRVLVSGGTVSTVGSKSFAGLLELSGGTLNVNADASAARYQHTASSILGGTGSLTLAGSAVWTAGSMTGAGSTTSSGTLELSGLGLKDLTGGRTLNAAGTTTWTNTAIGNGRIRTGGAVVINNSGSWLDQQAFSGSISPDLGAGASFNNTGAYIKSGAGSTAISIAFSNPGRVSVNAGQLDLTGGLSNFAGSTLSGGTFEISGAGTLRFTGANIVTNAATLLLDGAGSALLNASNGADALAGFNTNALAGSFSIRNGRNFTSAGAFGNAGIVNVGAGSSFTSGAAFTNQSTAQLQLAGGSFAGPSLANAGVTSGFGSVTPVVSNSGSVRASGGTLALAGGVLGATGTVQVDAGATLSLGAGSTARNLVHNGTLLALGSSNITVFDDYDNAGFGVGNAFDRRRGVSGSGQILASGTAQQTLSGALVSGGGTASATLALPTIRVGQGGVAASFTVGNQGLGGPSLRGALVTTGISNPGLTGSGVTAQNWGAVAQSGPGQTFSIQFDPGLGQALSGQVLQVVNNFDNVAGQTLAITGQAFNLASASAATPSPVVFANQRVGDALRQALTLSNLAPASGFSESLDASISASGTALANGSFSLLAAGASSSALQVGVDTSSAGAKSGVATIALASNGTGTSGFAPLDIGTQTVNVSGNVYRLAQPSTVLPNGVLLGNQREGGTLTQALTLSNLAAADGFSEALNASITAQGVATAGGLINLLAAGSSSSALFVGVDTSSAGAKSGTATITLASDGSGSSGLGSFALGTQSVTVSGDVYRLAQAGPATPASVTLADRRVGGGLAQAITLANAAAADGFSERLNGSIAASGSATAGGSFALLAAGGSSNALFVGVDTATAGAKSGTATISLASDGAGTSGFAAQALASQQVAVSGNVYRLAQPQVDARPLTLVARVGDAPVARGIAVSNVSPDPFTERLNASIAGTPAGISAGPALVGLAPNASDNLGLSLATGSAGSFGGTATVALVSSSAGTSSGAPDLALGSVDVAVDARVYAPAVAQLASTVVDFGTVRVGDLIAARHLTLGNAASGALTDTLQATLSGGGAPFSASGSLAGLAAGAGDASALQVQMATASAGVFSSSATLALNSQNPEMADLALAPMAISLQGQVNNLANAALSQTGGAGSFSGTAFSYTLDFGVLQLGSGTLVSSLSLANAVVGPADALSGSWDLSALTPGDAFTLAGFGSFANLASGSAQGGLSIGFDTANAGSFDRTVVFNGLSVNGSGPDLALPRLTLQLHGNVAAVPEPETWGMMLGGLLAVGALSRRRLQARAA